MRISRPSRRFCVPITLVVLATSLSFALSCGRAEETTVRVNYRELVDRSALSHSGQPVGQVLDYLAFRNGKDPKNPYSQRLQARREQIDLAVKFGGLTEEAADRQRKAIDQQSKLAGKALEGKELERSLALVEPFVEPCAFVLQDALAKKDPGSIKSSLVEVADAFRAGSRQPAWADLLRTRRYFVLADGTGYVRLFLPGRDAKGAYRDAKSVIQRVLAWLLRAPGGVGKLDVEAFAYENDFPNCTFTLHLPSYRFPLQKPLAAKDAIAVNWQSIAAFLETGATLEGAAITEGGELVLVGSQRENKPTLEGRPMTLADLAVAYRAVFYVRHNETYMSLDPSPFPESVNVNFGGRLQDTRLGWVALRCDLRFKTIGDGFDPVTDEQIADSIRAKMADFRTQQELRFSTPEKDRPREESTRFWFYPDGVRIAISPDRKQMQITSPRFKAAAERTEAIGSDSKEAEHKNPPWTEKAISHFNHNYDSFGGLYPEIRELDNVGRLLALFTWLQQYQAAAKVPLDLDALLDVELPACSTPRRRPQMLFRYYTTGEGKAQKVYVYNYSSLFRLLAENRQMNRVSLVQVRAEEARLVDRTLKAELAKAGVEYEKVKRDYHSWTVVTGGLDLSLRERLSNPGRLADGEKKLFDQLLDKPALQPLAGNKYPLLRTGGGGGRIPPPRDPPPLVSGPFEDPGRPFGDWIVSLAETKALDTVALVAKDKDGKPRLIHRAPARPSVDGPSLSIYLAENGSLDRVVRRENGRTVSYNLEGEDDNFVAKYSSRASTDSLLAAAAADEFGSSTRAWQLLPADTPILAIDRLGQGKVAVLSRERGRYRLKVIKEGRVEKEMSDGGALAALREGERAKAIHYSTDKLLFSFAAPEGSDMVFQVGKKKVSIPRDKWEAWVRDPNTEGIEELKELFTGAAAEGRTVILVRDTLGTRPKRFGDTPTVDMQDTVALGVLLRDRFAKTQFAIDDPSPEVAGRLKSMKDLQGPADLALAIPPGEARVDDKQLLPLIRSRLMKAGVVPIEKPGDLARVSNILVVNAHNNQELFDYLESLGKYQIDGRGALSGKLLLLNTCFDRGNPNMVTELIERYKLSGVYHQSEVIDSRALQPVLLEVAEILKEAKATDKPIHPADLLRKAADKVLQNERWSEIHKEVEKIKKGMLQVSFLERSGGACCLS